MKQSIWSRDITHEMVGVLAVFGLVMSSLVTGLGVAALGVQAQGVFAGAAAVAQAVPACGTLASGSSLAPGQSIYSCNGKYVLVYQTDGNLVLYTSSWKFMWASNTAGPAYLFGMQRDGNLVVYGSVARPVWATQTLGAPIVPGAYLAVQDDGNLVMYTSSDKPLWASDTMVVQRAPTWSIYCTGAHDPRGNNWQWWQVDDSTPPNYAFVRNGDGACIPTPPAAASYPLSSIATDWLVKSVCVDAQNHPIAADPYYNCPTDSIRRKITLGDALPYYTIDQVGLQISDSYPVLDNNNNALLFHTFDYTPFGTFNLFGGTDGYDVYAIRNGWVSISNTSDGGGYGTTFYGSGCTLGNGWGLFPETNFLSGGDTVMPIAGVYWEQSGRSFPGACPSGYTTDSHTRWEVVHDMSFGGFNGNSTKTMDALVSYHGFRQGAKESLEVFYFTQQYGLTKWEAWAPQGAAPAGQISCAGPNTRMLYGVPYTVTDCHDWSSIVQSTSADIPVWPLPNANILQYPHFDGGLSDASTKPGEWHRDGKSPAGNLINWSLRNSSASRDKARSSAGVRYLATNCGAGNDGQCSGPAVQEIYQDIPFSSIVAGGSYLFGLNASTYSGKGTLRITIQELDAKNRVLWQDFVEGTVSQDNGANPSAGEGESAYLSTAFIGKVTTIPATPGAVMLRYYFTPMTPQTFFVLNAHLGLFPVHGTLGSVSVSIIKQKSLAASVAGAVEGQLKTSVAYIQHLLAVFLTLFIN